MSLWFEFLLLQNTIHAQVTINFNFTNLNTNGQFLVLIVHDLLAAFMTGAHHFHFPGIFSCHTLLPGFPDLSAIHSLCPV